MAKPNDRILEIQDRVRTRSQDSRRRYLDDIAVMTDSPDSDRRQDIMLQYGPRCCWRWRGPE